MRLSLRLKIAGGFGLLIVLIALLGWVTLSLFFSLRTVQRRVFDDAIPSLVAVEEIVRSYTAQSAAVRGYLIGSQASLLEQYEREVATADVWEEQAARLFRAREERALLRNLIQAGDTFQELVDEQVIPLAEKGQRSQAFRVLGQDGTPQISQIEALGALLRERQGAAVVQSETDLANRSDATIFGLVVLVLGALGIGIALAVILPRHLVADLSKLVDAARGIGRGDFDQKLAVSSRDEVGELAARFGEMQLGLKRLQQLKLQDRELEIAAQIQRNLLQRTVPEIRGVRLTPLQRQANLVGGDWYNVDVRGRTLTIVVGDASGKGIAAALMATLALSALRAERGRGAGPAQVIEAANRTLREATDSESFTTLVYLTLNLDEGDVRWLNMGHHPPFVLRRDGIVNEDGSRSAQGFFLEGPRNRVLGWFEEPGVEDVVAQLQPGDRVILYTDGFLEAKTPEGEVFGEHRFGDALLRLEGLEPEALIQQMVEDVERFAAGKLDDDLTMLIVEWLGASADEPVDPSGEQRWHSKR